MTSQRQLGNRGERLDFGQFQIHPTTSSKPAFLITLDLDIEALIKALFK